MIKRLKNLIDEPIFRDDQTEVIYFRIVGAIGWPWEPKPGFVLVLGEQYRYDFGLQGRPLQLLAEREVAHLSALHGLCQEFRRAYACDYWLADLEQPAPLRLFRNLNQVQTDTDKIWLRQGPFSHDSDRLQTLFQMLGMVQSPERKLLTYGPNSKLAGQAMALSPDNWHQPLRQFPALAALAYAVGEMLLRQPGGRTLKPEVTTTWDRHAANMRS